MKHLGLFITMLLVSLNSFAQTIAEREDFETYSTITTTYGIDKSFFGYSTAVALSMLTNKTTDERVFQLFYYFETSGKTLCQKGSKLIIKTFQGSIITLEQILADDRVRSYRERVGSVEGNVYSLRGHYYIDEDDIKKLIDEGIQLIRVETLKGLIDYTYKTDTLGKLLNTEYDLLFEKQDFGSDF